MITILWLHQLSQYMGWNMLPNTTQWKFVYKWRFCRGLETLFDDDTDYSPEGSRYSLWDD
ncbi:MAG: hypothetical protein PUG96_06970 [Prevotellaceae bacterium]|nr:hypothetical protein [Prevotellaceae bacterium]